MAEFVNGTQVGGGGGGSGDFKADGSVAMTGNLDAGVHKVTNLVDPTAGSQEAATADYAEDYADSVASSAQSAAISSSNGYTDTAVALRVIGTGLFFGDGSDGDATIGAGTTTLSANKQYNNLTVPSGATLVTNGYMIWVKNLLTVGATGSLNYNGNDAVTTTPGAAHSLHRLGGGMAGGTPGIAGIGGNGGETTFSSSLGGAGGNGGNGSTGNGGNGGTVDSPHVYSESQSNLFVNMYGLIAQYNSAANTLAPILGGAGGAGGGGGDVVAPGGAGGGGGGCMIVNAKHIVITSGGKISVNGGAGDDAGAGTNGGGGGGGGGGVVFVNCMDYTGASPTATGGAAGLGDGTGTNGAAGATGTVRVTLLAS